MGQSASALNLHDIPQPGMKVKYIGDYELLEVIAHGGMGVVYKARQKSLNRIVAVKLLLGGLHSSDDFKKRLRKEAELAAQLNHPNIVAIYETGEFEGQPYFAMEYVAGPNLAELTRQQPLPPRKAAEYVKTVAEAISYAHQRSVLHRDLKPSNILIGPGDRPMTTDFGLARQIDADSSLTASGDLLGTPGFLPPEQVSVKVGQIGVHSDVYSLGAVLFYLLTGRPPFEGETLAMILRHISDTEPPRLRRLNSDVPPDLETICLKCLEKEPRQRYASATELTEELNRFREGKPILAKPANALERTIKWYKREPIVAWLTTAFMIVLVFGLVVSLFMWRSTEFERRKSQSLETALTSATVSAEQTKRDQELAAKKLSRQQSILTASRLFQNDDYIGAHVELCNVERVGGQPDIDLARIHRQLAWGFGLKQEWSWAQSNLAVVLQIDGTDDFDAGMSPTSLDSLFYCVALIKSGDFAGYDTFRRQLVQQYKNTTNAVAAEHVCKASLLQTPDQDLLRSLEPLGELTRDKLAISGKLPWQRAWAKATLALWDYRRGDYAKAIRWCEEVWSIHDGPPDEPARLAMTQALWAISKQRLNDSWSATNVINIASTACNQVLGQKRPTLKAEPHYALFDWISAELLVAEAQSCLGTSIKGLQQNAEKPDVIPLKLVNPNPTTNVIISGLRKTKEIRSSLEYNPSHLDMTKLMSDKKVEIDLLGINPGALQAIFDEDPQTFAIALATNRLVITVTFTESRELEGASIWMSGDSYRWRIRAADQLSDLSFESHPTSTGLDWATNRPGRWSGGNFRPAPILARVFQLEAQGLAEHSTLRLNEWQLNAHDR